MRADPNSDDFPLTGRPADTRYFDRNLDCEAVKILPGEYFVTAEDMVLVAVLGTCVAACIRDRERRIGGMNHFMLPTDCDAERAMEYGAGVMQGLVDCLLDKGAQADSLEAKIFGGGAVSGTGEASAPGERNADFVAEYLRDSGVAVLARDLRARSPLKIYFFPSSGRALIRRIARLKNDTLARRELEYAARLAVRSTAGGAGRFA
jgi:chemotaxis protein CheD